VQVTIHWINQNPEDSVICCVFTYPLDCDLSGPVVQRVDNADYRINQYPAESAVCFTNTYLLSSDSSIRECCPRNQDLVGGITQLLNKWGQNNHHYTTNTSAGCVRPL